MLWSSPSPSSDTIKMGSHSILIYLVLGLLSDILIQYGRMEFEYKGEKIMYQWMKLNPLHCEQSSYLVKIQFSFQFIEI